MLSSSMKGDVSSESDDYACFERFEPAREEDFFDVGGFGCCQDRATVTLYQ